jgi:hypothetical protein
MESVPVFIKGIELNRGYYFDIVKPLLDKYSSGIQYSAALIGYGSDVMGFDTTTSMDHNWGPRLQIFINDINEVNGLNEYFSDNLPYQYKNFSTNFSKQSYDGTIRMVYTNSKPINHLIEIDTFENYLANRYKINNITNIDWLKFIDQNLIEITSGEVFYDGLDIFIKTRSALKFYPLDICKLRLAVLWNYIWNKEAFIGRSIEIDDFIGLKIHANRIANYLMKILFYLEEKYIPYSKWFGTAFKKLNSYKDTKEPIENVLRCNEPKEIESNLCILYEKVIELHNKNTKLPHLNNKTRNFFNRPYKVIFSENIVEELINSIDDTEIKKTDIEEYGYDIILDK